MTQIKKSSMCLAGNFLLATPQMPDPRFARNLIYLCSHNEDGALGVVINRPDKELSFAQVLREIGMVVPDFSLPMVYLGGPVSLESAFVLYRSYDFDGNRVEVSQQVAFTREREILERIIAGKGPAEYLFLVGYVGWGAGQLEEELQDNSWLLVPGQEDLIFDNDDAGKWQKAAGYYGIDISCFHENIGRA